MSYKANKKLKYFIKKKLKQHQTYHDNTNIQQFLLCNEQVSICIF